MVWSVLLYILQTILSQWAFLLAVAFYLVWNNIQPPYAFFADRGIAFKKTLPLIGNIGRLFIKKESIFDMIKIDYDEFAGKKYSKCHCIYKLALH